MKALDFLNATVDAHGDVAAELRALVAGVQHLAGSDDADFAWAISRIAHAVGSPAAREAPDLGEVRALVRWALIVVSVKSARYYRIGEPFAQTLYEVVAVVVGDGAGSRAWLFPVPPAGQRYAVDFSVPAVSCGGRVVIWPPFKMPLVSNLVSSIPAERDASGFVAAELAVRGSATLPAPVKCEAGS